MHDWFADTKVIYSHIKEVKVPTPVKHRVIPTMGTYDAATYYQPEQPKEVVKTIPDEETNRE